uniref:mRNA 5'-phosphatase n=1 Tax=Trypanosoma congolense (strain IL3000) TaxID=1068625 RepID=G0UJZ9_TRYCI|nr:putative RNA triphosphatase [Trypanosoma congolense IL3000]
MASASGAERHIRERNEIVNQIFEKLRSHSVEKLELEARLCRLEDLRRDAHIANGHHDGGMCVVKSTVTAGVSEEHYCLIEDFCKMSKGVNVTRSESLDVISRGGRYTYTVDKPSKCISCLKKRRIFVVDIFVPFAAYDIRISASTETHGELPNPSSPPVRGFGRRKDRTSVEDGSIRYDLTKVHQDGSMVYEVELECLLKSGAETKVTMSDLDNLLTKALDVAVFPIKGC